VSGDRIPVVLVGKRKRGRPASVKKMWYDRAELPPGMEQVLTGFDVRNVVVHLRDGRSVVFENPEAFRERMALKGREGFSDHER